MLVTDVVLAKEVWTINLRLRTQRHVGLCAEFASLSWLAPTPEKALSGIRAVVAGVVKDLRASGELVPGAIAQRRYSGELRVRIPPLVHRQLALQAAEEGVSLNRLASAKLAA